MFIAFLDNHLLFFADEPHQTLDFIYLFADYAVFQLLEVIRLEGHPMVQEDAFVSRDIHLLQVGLTI